MNKAKMLMFLFFFCAAFFIIIGILLDEIKIGILVFFPFLIGSGFFAFFGFLFLFLAIIFFFLAFVGSFPSRHVMNSNDIDNREKTHSSIKTKGIIFIGPFPIIFGSDKKVSIILVLIAITGILLFYIGWFYLL